MKSITNQIYLMIIIGRASSKKYHLNINNEQNIYNKYRITNQSITNRGIELS